MDRDAEARELLIQAAWASQTGEFSVQRDAAQRGWDMDQVSDDLRSEIGVVLADAVADTDLAAARQVLAWCRAHGGRLQRDAATVQLGWKEYMLGDATAGEALIRSVAEDPTSPAQGEGQAFLGTILARSRRYDEAEVVLEASLITQPRSARALHYLGVVALSRRDYAKAVTLFRRGADVRAVPESGMSLDMLARTLAGLGRWSEAEATYQEWERFAAAPMPVEAKVRRTRALVDAGQPSEASAYLSTFDAEVDSRTLPDVLTLRGDILSAQGRPAEAAVLLRRAINATPPVDRKPQPLIALAKILVEAGNATEAVEAFREALAMTEEDPWQGSTWMHLARALTSLGDAAGARLAYTEALKGPHPKIIELAGRALARLDTASP